MRTLHDRLWKEAQETGEVDLRDASWDVFPKDIIRFWNTTGEERFLVISKLGSVVTVKKI